MNKEQFDTKYALYSELIFKISMTYLGNKADAEDITQEVFVKLFTNSEKFNDSEHERRWIIRVTINACKNYIGMFWNKNTVSIDSIQEISTEYRYSEVAELLFSLPPKYRIVLYLYYYEGYSVEEISSIIKIGKSAVKMRLKRGREKLKLDLEECIYEKERFCSYNR